MRIYRARDGRLLKTFRAATELYDAALSPDGKLAAAAGADGRVWLWDVDAGTPPRHLNHEAPVAGVAWSPSGDVLVSVGLAPSPSARLWNPSTGTLLHPLPHPLPLKAAVFSPDGRRLATYGDGPLARIWDVRTGILVSKLEPPMSDPDLKVTSAAFGPAGDVIVTGRGNFGRLWGVETGIERMMFAPHASTVTDVAFSPDGDRVATASRDSIARIWTVATGELSETLAGHAGLGINDVDFSPDVDARAMVSAGADGTASYSAAGQRSVALLGHDEAVLSASFSPDGRSILTASEDGTARLWDPFGEPVPKDLARYSSDVTTVAVDPTGSRIAVGREDGGVQVLAPNRRVISTPTTGIRRTVSVGWAGETLMAATSAGRVRIWDDSGRGALRELLHGSGIRAAAISRNGTLVATAGNDGTVRLWRLPGGTPETLDHDAAVTSVAFDATGRLVATGSGQAAYIWRTSDVELVEKLPLESEAGEVTAVAFGDQGRRRFLATASSPDFRIRVWDVRTRESVNTFIGHEGRVTGVSFSPDGRWLASASLRKAGVWQIGKSGLERNFLFFVAPLYGQQGPVTSIAFTRNQTIVMGTSHGEKAPYGAVRSYRCSLCRGLPQLVTVAKAKLKNLKREAAR